MWSTNKFIKRPTNFILSLVLLSAQLAPLFVFTNQAEAVVNECVVDTAGVNDEPGQKDLTKLCVDDTAVSSVDVTWNWDELGTSGANTLDACALFDTDGDGYVNYSVCVVTNGNPATLTSTVLYSCGDDKPDRCTSPVTPLAITNGTSCTVTSPIADDPFAGGDSYPNDTQADCELKFADVGGVGNAELIDVCSYPSQQPNSDPSDCVIIKDTTAFIKLTKQIEPSSDSGKFNLLVDGVVKAANVSDNGTTGIINVDTASSGTTFTVSETAGLNTSLASYSSNVQCNVTDNKGDLTAGPVVNATQTTITLKAGYNADCTFTNTVNPGSITIVKNTVGGNDTFNFTSNFGVSQITTVNGTGSQLVNNLTPGTYSIEEIVPAGWDLTSATCSDQSPISAISLQSDENITCTFTNTKRGQLIVQKTTLPAGDPTEFTVGVNTTNGGVIGDSQGVVTDSTDKTFTVIPGTYSVEETVPQGWAKTGDTCQNVVVAAGETKYCTITNTKLVSITIVKDALPANDGTAFPFSLSTDPVTNFTLDDDMNTQTPDSKSYLVMPGTYSITEDLSQLPWLLTQRSCGEKAFSELSNGVSITVAAGEVVSCTLTNTKFGSISGTKYEVDADGTTVKTLAEWTIKITNIDTGAEDTTTTDINGNYLFDMLLPGNYEVVEILQSGWTQLSPTGDGDYDISLAAGQNSTGNDFENFKNGTIKGYKWNDIDGDGNVDSEPKLAGWTIFIDTNNNQQLDNGELFDVTDASGNYEFTNLAPGSYTVCEVQQVGWVQTAPATQTGCTTTTIDDSGEVVTRNFGNQGRGTIKVVKNIDENNDGDLNDPEDVVGATNWVWNINGSGGYATGSTQNVPAGSYTVSEVQKDGYYVTYSSCSGETNGVVSTSLSVSVAPSENVVCTFTNAKKLGTLRVEKEVLNNSGGTANASDFSFYFNDAVLTSYNFINDPLDDEEGYYEFVLVPGTYELNENEFTGYELVSSTCDEVVVDLNQTTSCKFINDDIAPTLEVAKRVINDDGGMIWSGDFELFVNGVRIDDPRRGGGELEDNMTFHYYEGAKAGVSYSISETVVDGYSPSDVVCTYYDTDTELPHPVVLELGDRVVCTITNDDIAPILRLKKTVINDNGGTLDADNFGISVEGSSDPVFGPAVSEVGSTSVYEISMERMANVDITISEDDIEGYQEGTWSCSNGVNGTGLQVVVSLDEGDDVTCEITNNDIPPKVYVSKDTYPADDEETFAFTLLNNNQLYAQFSIGDGGSYNTGEGLKAGSVKVDEADEDGWFLVYANCYYLAYDGDYEYANYIGTEFNAEIGMTYYCEFENEKAGNVVVTKINDFNNNGEWDEDEPTLPDWEMNIERECELSLSREINTTEIGCYYTNSIISELTDSTGVATFNNLESGWYTLTETLKEGWVQSGIYCDGRAIEIDALEFNIIENEVLDSADLYVQPGGTVNCYVLNTKIEVDLEVDKDDAGVTTQAGAQFDYTIDVKNNSEVFEATEVTVTDELDENLKLLSTIGTDWLCSLVGQDVNGFGGTVTCEYGKALGVGESAPTLTFTVEVSPAPTVTSLDNEVVVTSKEPDSDSSNNTDTENTPIFKPQVLAAVKELPKTGESPILSIYVGLAIVLLAVILSKNTIADKQ